MGLLDELPVTDCHANLREELKQSEKLTQAPICISVAYDWMYRGYDAEGINREIASTVECASLCRQHNRQSLAIPETALLQMAKKLNPKLVEVGDLKLSSGNSILAFGNSSKKSSPRFCPSDLEICRGILPSLTHIVETNLKAVGKARKRIFTPTDPERKLIENKDSELVANASEACSCATFSLNERGLREGEEARSRI